MVVFYSPYITPRVEFAARLIFEDLLGYQLQFTEQLEDKETRGDEVLRINYSKQSLERSFQIIPHGLLFEKKIQPQNIKCTDWNAMPIFFQNEGDFSFDILAASFYLVTRYEEYLSHSTDQHDRFLPNNSLAYQESFLGKPLVNMWVTALREELEKRFGQQPQPTRTFKPVCTIDVDTAYAFKEKGTVRTSAALVRDAITFNFTALKERLRVLLRLQKDPFDVFDYLIQQQKSTNLPFVYFFLVADYGLNDKNIPISSNLFKALIKSMNDYAEVGLHPSYASYLNSSTLRKEHQRLESTLHHPVTKSRNHFLRLKLPDSYRQLIDIGIQEDYTMGYPQMPGFRASICTPFQFYDLQLERVTDLTVHPFCFMEATLKYYLGKEPDDVMDLLQPLLEAVKSVNGELVVVWHNDSLAETPEWAGWRSAFEKVLNTLSQHA